MNRLPLAPTRTLVNIDLRSGQGLALAATAIVAGSLLVALSAQFEVELPVSPVPITGQTFAVLLVGAAYGSRLGAATLGAYLLEGVGGMPVFAGGGSGWAAIDGPTGGYLLGFVAAAFAVGWLAERGWDRNPLTTAVAMVLGNVIIYAAGVTQLQNFVGWENVWRFGVRDFLAGDSVKILLAAGVLPGAWWLLRRLGGLAGRLPPPSTR